MRNVELTKQRFLAAAIAEFAERGLAGARIDRIADQAGANKALIYAYFGNKEALFDAALGATVQRIIADVPIDATDLPGYAVRRFDWQRAHLDTFRLIDWARLERVDTDAIPEVVAASDLKLAAVAQAQRDGVVSARFAPAQLLALINALVMATVPPDADDATVQERRQAIIDAVRVLVAP